MEASDTFSALDYTVTLTSIPAASSGSVTIFSSEGTNSLTIAATDDSGCVDNNYKYYFEMDPVDDAFYDPTLEVNAERVSGTLTLFSNSLKGGETYNFKGIVNS